MEKSDPKEIKVLFKKYNKLIGEKRKLADFKEPVILLERRDGGIDFYEDATAGDWAFTHSDGIDRIITLHPKFVKKFRYGKNFFRGYWCHEDYPFPLTAEVLCPVETFTVAIEKALNDIRKWRAKEWEAKGNFWWKLALGICAVAGMYILYKLVVPQDTTVETKVVEKIVENTSRIIPVILD